MARRWDKARCLLCPTDPRWDWAWIFAASTFVVVLGVALGQAFVRRGLHASGTDTSLVGGFVRWDGTYYRDIATLGYVPRPGQSPIHFPPAYPLLARGVWWILGGTIETAMVLTAHACLLIALALLAGYTDSRQGASYPHARPAALAIAGFFPAGMFFHVGYSESLFLLVCVGMLCLIQAGASPVWVAGLGSVGLTTRFVGVALVLPALVYAWQYGRGGWRSLGWVAICLPLVFTALAGLMWYHDTAFGDPILFARGRSDLWRMQEALPPGEKAARLLLLEPVRGVFNPASPLYWGRYFRSPAEALFSIYPANAVVFLLALALTGWGMGKGLLNRHEVAMTAGLLAIPYWVGGYDMNMTSMARYVSVAAPLYPVAGVLLARCGPVGMAGFAGCGATLMMVYAALYSQGHWII